MCIELESFRLRSYGHTMAKVQALIGVRSIWDADLQRLPIVRALAVAGRLELLDCLLASAKVQASKIGFASAVLLIKDKQAELAALREEVVAFQIPFVDVVPLDADWGRKGRGARIMDWIVANKATAIEVAERFQLARSTAMNYVRKAKRLAARMPAMAAPA